MSNQDKKDKDGNKKQLSAVSDPNNHSAHSCNFIFKIVILKICTSVCH